MAVTASIALGSNLGDRRAAIDGALRALRATPGVNSIRESRPYETPPVGGPSGQGAFLNSAATIETTLDPVALHQQLAKIEQGLGRVRKERWGERAIDLDIVLYGDLILDSPSLTIPHPRMAVRRFVLVPLAEVAPDAVDPMTGRTVESLLANLDRRPGCVVLLGNDGDDRARDLLVARLAPIGGFEVHKALARFEAGAGLVEDSTLDEILLGKDDQIDLGLWSDGLSDGRWLYNRGSMSGWGRQTAVWHQLVRPTFVAALDPVSYGVHRRWREGQVDPVFREVPILWPGAADPWPLYDAWKSAVERGAKPPETRSENVDAIVSGIVAACEASRTETRMVAS